MLHRATIATLHTKNVSRSNREGESFSEDSHVVRGPRFGTTATATGAARRSSSWSALRGACRCPGD